MLIWIQGRSRVTNPVFGVVLWVSVFRSLFVGFGFWCSVFVSLWLLMLKPSACRLPVGPLLRFFLCSGALAVCKMSAARVDDAAEAWVTAHLMVRTFGADVATGIISCLSDWSRFDDRWTAPDGQGGWLQLGALNDACLVGGWCSLRWLWVHGWVVEESSMSDWTFWHLHMRRLRIRIAAGHRHASW